MLDFYCFSLAFYLISVSIKNRATLISIYNIICTVCMPVKVGGAVALKKEAAHPQLPQKAGGALSVKWDGKIE